MYSPPIFFILPTPLSPVLRFFFLLPRRTLSSPPPSCRARSGAARHSVVPRPSPEELPREEVRRAPAVSSQGATAPPTARPAARRCRARRSGAPPPRRSEELPRPRPLGPPRGGPARPRPAVVRSCRAPDAVASLDPLICPPDPPLRVLPATLLHCAHFQVCRPRS